VPGLIHPRVPLVTCGLLLLIVLFVLWFGWIVLLPPIYGQASQPLCLEWKVAKSARAWSGRSVSLSHLVQVMGLFVCARCCCRPTGDVSVEVMGGPKALGFCAGRIDDAGKPFVTCLLHKQPLVTCQELNSCWCPSWSYKTIFVLSDSKAAFCPADMNPSALLSQIDSRWPQTHFVELLQSC